MGFHVISGGLRGSPWMDLRARVPLLLPPMNQGSRPVEIFFRSVEIFFRGPNFKPGCPGIWQARGKKNKLGIPAAGLALTQPRRDLFFADREISSPAGLKFGRPRAGRARPIRDSL